MLKWFIGSVTALILGSLLNYAGAASPVWELNVVYSNADGTVQFVVHSTPESGQQYLGGLTLGAYSEGPRGAFTLTHAFTFPRDLPGDSAGHSFLIATQGFADLGVLPPDYVVPNGFFPVAGGAVGVADHGYQYPPLPTDGVKAYWADNGYFGAAVATNFAGGRYTFASSVMPPSPPPPSPPPPSPPPPSPSPSPLASATIGPAFTGSWYDPAQSGHGLFIEVLPDNRFYAAWFAFNPAGTQQTWFTGVGTYSGNIATLTAVEQPAGGRWIPNFDPSQIVRNAWGTLIFTFTDCNHGTVNFNSMIGYGTGSMNLTRLTLPAGLSCP